MGTVYRESFTKPLPAGAKIIVRKGQRFAEWKDAKGKTRTAPLTIGKDGTERILLTAATYTAKYRDTAANCPGQSCVTTARVSLTVPNPPDDRRRSLLRSFQPQVSKKSKRKPVVSP